MHVSYMSHLFFIAGSTSKRNLQGADSIHKPMGCEGTHSEAINRGVHQANSAAATWGFHETDSEAVSQGYGSLRGRVGYMRSLEVVLLVAWRGSL